MSKLSRSRLLYSPRPSGSKHDSLHVSSHDRQTHREQVSFYFFFLFCTIRKKDLTISSPYLLALRFDLFSQIPVRQIPRGHDVLLRRGNGLRRPVQSHRGPNSKLIISSDSHPLQKYACDFVRHRPVHRRRDLRPVGVRLHRSAKYVRVM